jgi:hypothetical protein
MDLCGGLVVAGLVQHTSFRQEMLHDFFHLPEFTSITHAEVVATHGNAETELGPNWQIIVLDPYSIMLQS